MKLIAALVMLLALSACSLPVFFRVPIVQGNIVTADQVGQLQKGMTKKQVAYVLGTPLIKSPFEADRWDYVFYYRNPRAHVRESKLDLYFANGKLADIEGDEEYTAQAFKAGDQQGSGDDASLPGETSAIGAPLSATKSPSESAGTSSEAAGRVNSAVGNTPGLNRPSNVGSQGPMPQSMEPRGEPDAGAQRPQP